MILSNCRDNLAKQSTSIVGKMKSLKVICFICKAPLLGVNQSFIHLRVQIFSVLGNSRFDGGDNYEYYILYLRDKCGWRAVMGLDRVGRSVSTYPTPTQFLFFRKISKNFKNFKSTQNSKCNYKI